MDAVPAPESTVGGSSDVMTTGNSRDATSSRALLRPVGPATHSLRNTKHLAADMVLHFKHTVAQCQTLPADTLDGDVTRATRSCLRIAAAVLDGRDVPTEKEVAQLATAAGNWAREGIPLDVVVHAVHEGTKLAQALVAGRSTSAAANTELGARTVDLLDLMTTTVTMSYLREYRAVAGQHHNAVHTLTTALLAGQATAGMARECGTTVATAYHVVAVSLPESTTDPDIGHDARITARRVLRRVQSELAAQCGAEGLHLLSTRGGTILVPTTSTERITEIVHALAESAAVPLTAVHAEAATDSVPEISRTLHDMLDIAVGLDGSLPDQGRTQVYRFGDLAAEYQLTRPGPTRAALAAKLDPLAEHPYLYETLCVYLLTEQSRQRAARRLHIHPNTVDYRLKRILEFTGIDATHPEGMWVLRAAMIARTCPRRPTSDSPDTVPTV